MPKSELWDGTVELLHETPNAWLVNDGTKQAWIPKSVGELEKNNDNSYTLTIPQAWAENKGFI